MYIRPHSFILLCLLVIFSLSSPSQNCNCTLDQVLQNTVAPCTKTVGTVVNVATVNELKSAISQANNNGGNMTILIADGTYQVASTTSYPYITASNMVFRSQSGNRDNVILQGGGNVSVSPNTEIGIYAVGDNITIADLTINNVGNHGIAVTGDSLFVHNVKIQDTYEQMIKGNSSGDGADYGIVQCSYFEYTSGIGPNWYIGGLDIHEGDGWIVRDNYFEDIASPHTALAEHAVHFWDNSADNLVERNMIVNCDRGIGFGLGSSANDGGVIRNNMIYNDGQDNYHDVGIGLETSPNTKVYHNTVVVAYQNAIEYRFSATTNVEIENNLTNQPITSRNGGQANVGVNLTNAQNAWFVNVGGGDLHLNSGLLPAVDQGTNLAGQVDMDIDQMGRPLGPAYDIGADEFLPPVGVVEAELEPRLYPQPALDWLHVELPEALGAAQYELWNGEGRQVKRGTMRIGSNRLDLRELPSGIYFLALHGVQNHFCRFFLSR